MCCRQNIVLNTVVTTHERGDIPESCVWSYEETSKSWSYSVVDEACLTAGHNHTSYEVVEGMNPPTREEKNNITHMNSHIKIIQLGLATVSKQREHLRLNPEDFSNRGVRENNAAIICQQGVHSDSPPRRKDTRTRCLEGTLACLFHFDFQQQESVSTFKMQKYLCACRIVGLDGLTMEGSLYSRETTKKHEKREEEEKKRVADRHNESIQEETDHRL
ncbi:hypothetical protein D9C73_012966 [Collichthys lucidus]|uniref:Uncharacterized protein n=1 Tax=Collichthys lucidus TaxID=240159 RepID=A0A4U5UU08_COLLU|nr:hypothetical protein D9C73_012966 [Collichthys lucidus]